MEPIHYVLLAILVFFLILIITQKTNAFFLTHGYDGEPSKETNEDEEEEEDIETKHYNKDRIRQESKQESIHHHTTPEESYRLAHTHTPTPHLEESHRPTHTHPPTPHHEETHQPTHTHDPTPHHEESHRPAHTHSHAHAPTPHSESHHEEEHASMEHKPEPDGVGSSSLLQDISHFYKDLKDDIYTFFYPHDEEHHDEEE